VGTELTVNGDLCSLAVKAEITEVVCPALMKLANERNSREKFSGIFVNMAVLHFPSYSFEPRRNETNMTQ